MHTREAISADNTQSLPARAAKHDEDPAGKRTFVSTTDPIMGSDCGKFLSVS
jgi:hypothetical protein